MKKLPPYGKALFELQSKGYAPKNSVYLFTGLQAFDRAAGFQSQRSYTFCIPPYLCPSIYYFPVKSCDILIFDKGCSCDDYLNDIAFYLYREGADKVRCVTFWREDALDSYRFISFVN